MIELEKTYLAKYLPQDLLSYNFDEIFDRYFPFSAKHPIMRLRKKGQNIEITKKSPIGNDSSKQEELTIHLTEEEYQALLNTPGKDIHKKRYFYPHQDRIAEFDIFEDDLTGLVVVDVEFENEEAKDKFTIPDFCLVEVTFENFIAAGMLAGKTYLEIEPYLNKLGYKKL